MKTQSIQFVACIASLLLAFPAFAQDQQARFERRLEQVRREKTPPAIDYDPAVSIPLGKRALIDYGGYLAFDYFSLEDSERNTHVLREYDLIGYAHVNIDSVHDFFLRARASHLDFADGDSFDGEGDESEFRLERAHYRFDWRDASAGADVRAMPDPAASVQVGRQLAFWGNGLVISTVLDGAAFTFRASAWELALLGGVTSRETIDFDTSRPDFDEETRRGLYGATLSVGLGKHRPFAYALIQEDYNDDEPLWTGGVETRFDYESHYLGVGAAGAFGDRLAYSVEGVYEGGTGLSNSFQTTGGGLEQVRQRHEEIHAFAFDGRVDYLFTDPRNSRVSGEVLLATGDEDRLHSSNTFGGNQVESSDRGFNSLGLINTGVAFSPAVSNLIAVRVGGATFPLPGQNALARLQVGADLFVYWKWDEEGGIDETTSDERYLGWEPDFYVNWQVTEDLTLAVRYGIFFPGRAFGDDDDSRQSLFIGVTYAF